jgi:glycosyltransferase involved in cell wall biosynthesis
MRIGFMIPSDWALVRGHGVVVQAQQQAEALESIGHTVDLLTPWEWQDIKDLDVLHFFAPSVLFPALDHRFPKPRPTLVAYSPIIDSNQSFTAYRWAADLGSFTSRLTTIPGIVRTQAQHSDLVICRSQHELKRARHSLKVPTAKLEIVLNGCSEPRTQDIGVDSVMNSLDLPKEFVLHISAFTQDRKNVLRLAQAAAELGLPLVIAGRATAGPILDDLNRRISQGQRIIMFGFVDESTKAALYSRCKVFSLPSHHEGTGLVAVEAASYGANLVITRNGGPPDYFLGLAEYVNPFDVSDIKRGLAAAWNRPKDDRLRTHSMSTLTWKHSARSLADAYSKHRQLLRTT